MLIFERNRWNHRICTTILLSRFGEGLQRHYNSINIRNHRMTPQYVSTFCSSGALQTTHHSKAQHSSDTCVAAVWPPFLCLSQPLNYHQNPDTSDTRLWQTRVSPCHRWSAKSTPVVTWDQFLGCNRFLVYCTQSLALSLSNFGWHLHPFLHSVQSLIQKSNKWLEHSVNQWAVTRRPAMTVRGNGCDACDGPLFAVFAPLSEP